MGSTPLFSGSTPDFSVGLVLLIILNFWVLVFVSLCSVSFTQCCLWIDHSWLSLQLSLCGSNVYLLQQRTVHSNLYTADIFPVYNKGDGIALNIIFHNKPWTCFHPVLALSVQFDTLLSNRVYILGFLHK